MCSGARIIRLGSIGQQRNLVLSQCQLVLEAKQVPSLDKSQIPRLGLMAFMEANTSSGEAASEAEGHIASKYPCARRNWFFWTRNCSSSVDVCVETGGGPRVASISVSDMADAAAAMAHTKHIATMCPMLRRVSSDLRWLNVVIALRLIKHRLSDRTEIFKLASVLVLRAITHLGLVIFHVGAHTEA